MVLYCLGFVLKRVRDFLTIVLNAINNCTVTSNIGVPLAVVFNFTCFSWIDKDKNRGIIEYNFIKQDSNTFLN